MASVSTDIVSDKVREIASRVTGLPLEKIDLFAPMSKLGIDSLMALSVVAAIEKQLKVNIPERRLRGIKNINDLVLVILNGKP